MVLQPHQKRAAASTGNDDFLAWGSSSGEFDYDFTREARKQEFTGVGGARSSGATLFSTTSTMDHAAINPNNNAASSRLASVPTVDSNNSVREGRRQESKSLFSNEKLSASTPNFNFKMNEDDDDDDSNFSDIDWKDSNLANVTKKRSIPAASSHDFVTDKSFLKNVPTIDIKKEILNSIVASGRDSEELIVLEQDSFGGFVVKDIKTVKKKKLVKVKAADMDFSRLPAKQQAQIQQAQRKALVSDTTTSATTGHIIKNDATKLPTSMLSLEAKLAATPNSKSARPCSDSKSVSSASIPSNPKDTGSDSRRKKVMDAARSVVGSPQPSRSVVNARSTIRSTTAFESRRGRSGSVPRRTSTSGSTVATEDTHNDPLESSRRCRSTSIGAGLRGKSVEASRQRRSDQSPTHITSPGKTSDVGAMRGRGVNRSKSWDGDVPPTRRGARRSQSIDVRVSKIVTADDEEEVRHVEGTTVARKTLRRSQSIDCRRTQIDDGDEEIRVVMGSAEPKKERRKNAARAESMQSGEISQMAAAVKDIQLAEKGSNCSLGFDHSSSASMRASRSSMGAGFAPASSLRGGKRRDIDNECNVRLTPRRGILRAKSSDALPGASSRHLSADGAINAESTSETFISKYRTTAQATLGESTPIENSVTNLRSSGSSQEDNMVGSSLTRSKSRSRSKDTSEVSSSCLRPSHRRGKSTGPSPSGEKPSRPRSKSRTRRAERTILMGSSGILSPSADTHGRRSAIRAPDTSTSQTLSATSANEESSVKPSRGSRSKSRTKRSSRTTAIGTIASPEDGMDPNPLTTCTLRNLLEIPELLVSPPVSRRARRSLNETIGNDESLAQLVSRDGLSQTSSSEGTQPDLTPSTVRMLKKAGISKDQIDKLQKMGLVITEKPQDG
jgi:hypothetical protein